MPVAAGSPLARADLPLLGVEVARWLLKKYVMMMMTMLMMVMVMMVVVWCSQ